MENIKYSLSHSEYTLRNALVWGNCFSHYRKASSERPFLERLFHGTLSAFEALPVLGQAVSLAEMGVVHLLNDLSPTNRLAIEKIFPVEENCLTVSNSKKRERISAVLPDEMTLVIPKDKSKLEKALSPVQHRLDLLYHRLPWPVEVRKVVVFTEVCDGLGDIAAAGKCIDLLYQSCPWLQVDWIFLGLSLDECNPRVFLSIEDSSKVFISKWNSYVFRQDPVDLLIMGPVKLRWSKEHISYMLSLEITGPLISFVETGAGSKTFSLKQLETFFAEEELEETEGLGACNTMHSMIFPVESSWSFRELAPIRCIPMGLEAFQGVFLDRKRLAAPLSQGYYCPSYLFQIHDENLRRHILESMGVFNSKPKVDCNRYSFNFGYAHLESSWGNFIDVLALHEKEKNVVVVLSQKGLDRASSSSEFLEKILLDQRIRFLKEKGYGTVYFKGEDLSHVFRSKKKEGDRTLTIIVRPFFTPEDVFFMQLAAERLLATGDNSAVESWCSRCKLYLYEDVNNWGYKWKFLSEQVSLAAEFSPQLSRLLSLFGGSCRNRSLNKPFTDEEIDEVEEILKDPGLAEATLQFCDHIVTNYSLAEVLEGSIKRSLWHKLKPNLLEVESKAFPKKFYEGVAFSMHSDPVEPLADRIILPLAEIQDRIENAIYDR